MLIKIGPVGNHDPWRDVRGLSFSDSIRGLADPSPVEWDDKGLTELVGILISYGNEDINSLQFQYYQEEDPDRCLVLSGTLTKEFRGPKFSRIILNYPSERITWVSGYDDDGSIKAMTFGTNKRSYGPFGSPGSRDQEFLFQFGDQGEFAGFYGRCSGRLRSIGAYIKPITTLIELIPKNLD